MVEALTNLENASSSTTSAKPAMSMGTRNLSALAAENGAPVPIPGTRIAGNSYGSGTPLLTTSGTKTNYSIGECETLRPSSSRISVCTCESRPSSSRIGSTVEGTSNPSTSIHLHK